MPELPEVETIRRGLANCLVSFKIFRLKVYGSRVIASPGGIEQFKAGLEGSTIGTWLRRGKYLLAKLEPKRGTWGIHFRMTGRFQWCSEPISPCRHTRVRLWNCSGQELRFVDTRNFGEMWWVQEGEPLSTVITGLKRLGPEPFSERFTGNYMKQRLMNSIRPIKMALLDQTLVAGVGNIYADESLFAAKISPLTASKKLTIDQLNRLRDEIVSILKTSIRTGGTTFSDFRDLEGNNGSYKRQLLVYQRGGQPCQRCGALICRGKLSGRSTHWCPDCQQ
ncbi:DNA-formamidopyrimidine glycosylase [Synechococcus sp. M16CYN]|uniref:DNA-formamidopyrimidine glycosylase n=1 Tax=Synechococcus sp. M16CYN TaxID=3103139 RepID=UPI00325065CF